MRITDRHSGKERNDFVVAVAQKKTRSEKVYSKVNKFIAMHGKSSCFVHAVFSNNASGHKMRLQTFQWTQSLDPKDIQWFRRHSQYRMYNR